MKEYLEQFTPEELEVIELRFLLSYLRLQLLSLLEGEFDLNFDYAEDLNIVVRHAIKGLIADGFTPIWEPAANA